MKFVIVHGAFGSPEKNWFSQLKDQLEALGQEVIVPQFPVDNWDEITKNGPGIPPHNQKLDSWKRVFNKEVVSLIKPEDKLCFIGHSLGPVFILQMVDHFKLNLDSAIFVSPFLTKLNRAWQIDHVNATFYKTDFDFLSLKRLIPVSYVLYSDNDPYVDHNQSILFAKALDSSLIFVRNAKHMNSEVNLNEFPLVFDLCATRLDLSLYQHYLAHRMKQYVNDFIAIGNSGVMKLRPEDVIDEGIFHFTHLQKSGFCTLFTGLIRFWNPESQYMKDGRKAAGRGIDLTRVILLEKPQDINNVVVNQQIALDLQAGIMIRLCLYADIKSEIPEPDFGIWDNNYVCIVRYDKKANNVYEIELNRKEFDLSLARKWRDTILSKSKPISNLQDLQLFHQSLLAS